MTELLLLLLILSYIGYLCIFYSIEQDLASGKEKCVDIALAIEMLYFGMLPTNVFDIAVLVTGDKDYMPVLTKLRNVGKQVAICSMVNSCNRGLSTESSNIRDYQMIWLDNYLPEIVKNYQVLTKLTVDPALLLRVVYNVIHCNLFSLMI
jgi:hypothetical protein